MRRAWYLLLAMALLRYSDDGGPGPLLDHLTVDLGDGSIPDRAASDGPRDGAGDGPGVTDLTQAPDGGSPTTDCPKLPAATGATVQVQCTSGAPRATRWWSAT